MQHVEQPHIAYSEFEISKTLSQTYTLLSITLIFSAVIAFVSQQMNLPHPGMWVTIGGFYGLLFAIHYFKNSIAALPLTFALTGLMGYTLGPILNNVLAVQNGVSIIGNAFGLTALVFFSLSAYVLKTKKDMSFLGGFLMAGVIALIGGTLLHLFTDIQGLGLALSVGFVIFSSAVILFQTSAIIHGGERNYILATISLYVSIYNLFLSFLNLLSSRE